MSAPGILTSPPVRLSVTTPWPGSLLPLRTPVLTTSVLLVCSEPGYQATLHSKHGKLNKISYLGEGSGFWGAFGEHRDLGFLFVGKHITWGWGSEEL